MKKIKIIFISGCLNKQKGINKNDLYYSIISKYLNKNNIEHQILLGNYYHYNQLVSSIEKYIKQKQPDLIYMFIRPFPLMELNKPFIKYINDNNKKLYAVHPQLLSRKMEWDDKLSIFHKTVNNNIIKRRKLFYFQDINIFLGIILKLHMWSLKYLIFQLNIVKQICNNNNIKLTIIMPPKYGKTHLSNYIVKSTDKYLTKNLKTSIINISDIDDYEMDKIHLNVNGHKTLGKRIYDDIILTIRN